MKIIIINIIVGLSAVGWVAYMFLSSYGAAFGSASGQSAWDKMPGFVTWSVVLVAILSIILSHVDRSRGLLWALIPFVWIVAMYVYILVLGNNYKSEFIKAGRKDDTTNLTHFATISHDYVCKQRPSGSDGFTPPVLDYFLTHDTANKTLVSIKVAPWNGVEVSPFGKINGTTLETFYDNKLELPDCVDKNGKTIADNYKVVYKPDQKYEDYHLEKYEANQENH